MQTKVYNTYRITHKNGSVEDINALDMVQALENTDIPSSESEVVQSYLVRENVRTLVEDATQEILFSSVVATGGGGSIATPASGKVHAGDEIAFRAIADRGYRFVSWQVNGEVISNDAELAYTMPTFPSGVNTVVFTATFELAPVSWKTEVEPAQATGDGCLAFPSSGTSNANTVSEFLAVAKTGWTFSHWDVNGDTSVTSEILSTEVKPLAEGETERVYKAVFTAVSP